MNRLVQFEAAHGVCVHNRIKIYCPVLHLLAYYINKFTINLTLVILLRLRCVAVWLHK